MDTTLTFKDEDHTLGVIIQRELLKNPDASFVAYKVPHPLYRSMQVRVQTMNKPTQKAIDIALKNTMSTVNKLDDAFKEAIKKWELDCL